MPADRRAHAGSHGTHGDGLFGGRLNVSLGYYPRAWQQTCHLQRDDARFLVLVLHRRAGKTELALMELIDGALRCKLGLGMFVYIAPLLKQAKAIAWARLKQRLRPLRNTGMVALNESELSVTVTANGACIRLFGADNPDALRGLRIDGCVVDEVAQVKPEVWHDILQPALSDRLGWAIFIGTPSGVNLFSELYHRAESGLSGWFAARWTVYDTDAIDPLEVERLANGGMPDNSFAREYLCDFAAGAEDQLVSLSDVEAAAKRSYSEADIYHAPRILGVDPARMGDDRSVVILRRGLVAFPPDVYLGIDNMALAARVASKIIETSPDAVFIDSGAGAGVIDRLRQLGHKVQEIPFGGQAIKPGLYVNRRTEMWWNLKEWLEAGGQIPDDRHLKSELATPKYWYDKQGKRVLESKDDIKKRLQGGQSPDLADALALTFAAPVAAPMGQIGGPQLRQTPKPYDPFVRFSVR